MSKTIYKIAPNADTIIILKNPLVDFAVWNHVDLNGSAAQELISKPELGTEEYPFADPVHIEFIEEPSSFELATEEPATEEPATEEPATEEPATEEPATEEPATEEPATEESATGEPTDEEITSIEDPATEPIEFEESDHFDGEEIYYYVSSSHLRQASPKFESMLSGRKWKEGLPDKNDGYFYVSAEDWDRDAFLVFLNVLHLRNSQVPRSVPLDMLAKIAVLADYYNCLEALELSTEMWRKDLKNATPIPSEHCRDLILWLCIAWVLRLPEDFAQMTAVAIKQSQQEELSTLGLPITGFVDRIDQARIRAIGTVISNLHDLLDTYRRPDYDCPGFSLSFECGSILYGALTKGMETSGLLTPYPMAPFSGMSLDETCSKVRGFKSPVWHNSGLKRSIQHACDLNRKVTEIADKVEGGIRGLELKEFGRA